MAGAFLAVAGNTVRELVRSKLLYNLLLFAGLLIAASMFVAQLSVGDWQRIMLDMGLAGIQISAALVAILIGSSVVAGEVERRTIFATLAKPLTRGVFLLGRFTGLGAVLIVNVAAMTTLLLLVQRLAGYSFRGDVVVAAVLLAAELLLLAAFAILFSSFTTPTLASAFTLSVFLIGHLLSDVRSFADRSKNPLAKALAGGVWRVLPDLELFNLKPYVANQIPVPPRFAGTALLYGGTYAAAVLLLSGLLFRRRDLK